MVIVTQNTIEKNKTNSIQERVSCRKLREGTHLGKGKHKLSFYSYFSNHSFSISSTDSSSVWSHPNTPVECHCPTSLCNVCSFLRNFIHSYEFSYQICMSVSNFFPSSSSLFLIAYFTTGYFTGDSNLRCPKLNPFSLSLTYCFLFLPITVNGRIIPRASGKKFAKNLIAKLSTSSEQRKLV